MNLDQSKTSYPASPVSNSQRSQDVRMISAMRLALSASTLVIIWIDPPQPNRFLPATYITLFLYTLYSLFVYIAALRWRKILPISYLQWIDLSWYLLLIAFSGGT